MLGIEPDPWQRWLAVHAGELLPDGRPRFRRVLVLVARQNGKTMFARILTLFWMFVEMVPLVLGTSTSRDYAKESWREVCDMAKENDYLRAELDLTGEWGQKAIRETVGEETLTTMAASRYKIAAANRRAGRSLTVHRLIIDEIREHQTWDAWAAAYNAMNAVPAAQVFSISNQGDITAIVLNSFRDSALDHIETGQGDPRLGLFEWSAEPGAEPDDPKALARANPNLGDRIVLDTLMGSAKDAKRAGGEELAVFRTEVMCQRVHLLDAAIDEYLWEKCGTDEPVDLGKHRKRVALALDLALDGTHATLVAAAQIGDLVHIDVVAAWSGHDCATELQRELPGIVEKVKPRAVGWFPQGPAAALGADLRVGWAPRGTEVVEVKGELTAACMGLALEVKGRKVRHALDPLLTDHVTTAQKLRRGDAWVFTRRGAAPVDGAYAVAGAVQLARTLPPPRPDLTVV